MRKRWSPELDPAPKYPRALILATVVVWLLTVTILVVMK